MPSGIYRHKKGYRLSEEHKRKLSLVKLGKKPSQETIEKRSQSMKLAWRLGKIKKGWKLSEETKKRIGLASLGNKHALGYKHSEEAKKKIKLAGLGRIGHWSGKRLSEEHRKKISLSSMGKPKTWWLGGKHSIETKRKMSEASKKNGNTPPSWKGKKHSVETKRKIGLANKGRQLSEESKRKMSVARTERPNRIFKDTSIELKLQQLLKEAKIEFETNYPILGRPDIFIKPNICIFADGCYWHKCPDCGFDELRQRDKEVTEELQKQDYTVIRLWEHGINNNQFNELNQLLC